MESLSLVNPAIVVGSLSANAMFGAAALRVHFDIFPVLDLCVSMQVIKFSVKHPKKVLFNTGCPPEPSVS